MKPFAFIFPGQGSQHVGMLKELAEEYKYVTDVFEEASDTLGYDLWELVQSGPEDKLNQTEYTQPALLAASVSVWRIWKKNNGPMPQFMAGHSLGEYAALVCADALDFCDAITLVTNRGRFMQEAVPVGKGAMAAIIGLENSQVQEICESVAEGEVVVPANFNAFGQVVIAGEFAAVHRAVSKAKTEGAKLAKVLPVSVPSHSPLMQPASVQLAKVLGEISLNKPTIPVVNNVDADVVLEPSLIKDTLLRQLASPVRWVEVIEKIVSEGVTQIVECGPGNVLSGLNKRIDSSIESIRIIPPKL